MATYRVPEWNLAKLNQTILDLNKRAKRLKLPPIVNRVDGIEEVRHEPTDETPWPSTTLYYHIDIEGQTPLVDGWRFAAKAEVLDEGNVVKVSPHLPGGMSIPATYWTDDIECEHCHKQRRRNAYYILEKSGHFKSVGSSCLRDFLNAPIESIVAMFESDWQIACDASGAERDGWGGPRVKPRIETIEYLSTVAAMARHYGYVTSRMSANGEGRATAGRAWDFANNCLSPAERKDYETDGFEITPADVTLAQEAIEWVKGREVTSDFDRSLATAAVQRDTLPNAVGFTAYIIGGYLREKQDRVVKAAAPISSHVGTIGQRQEMVLSPKNLRAFESDYGTRYLVTFADQDGNSIIWWTGNPPAWVDNQDIPVKVKATVKDHTIYNGTKQTVVSRVS